MKNDDHLQQGSTPKTHTHGRFFSSRARQGRGGVLKPTKKKLKKELIFSTRTEIPTLRLVFLFGFSRRKTPFSLSFTVLP